MCCCAVPNQCQRTTSSDHSRTQLEYLTARFAQQDQLDNPRPRNFRVAEKRANRLQSNTGAPPLGVPIVVCASEAGSVKQ